VKNRIACLLAGASATALSSAAYAQGQPAVANIEEIVVTGSRVVANGNQAPTPVTVLATERLMETSPSNIPDALQRLPQFASQIGNRNIGAAGANGTGNYLSLRQFGSNRNLVLLDGSRLPPTAANGSVDTNVVPQSLIQRVEIVTGGASAVYGSDAVTGVINFIIDKNFTGVKLNSQIGISTYGDGTSWRVGGAVGTPVFGGRGHIVASYDHYEIKGIFDMESRPPAGDYPTVGGTGTAANPYRLIQHGRRTAETRGGLIVNTNVPGLRDINFKSDGVPSLFVHGGDTGVSGLESGGDGFVYTFGTISAPLRTNQAFLRFEYDLTDTVKAYAQASYNDSFQHYPYTGNRMPGVLLSGNPFIPASIQSVMTATNTPRIEIMRRNYKEDGLPGRYNRNFQTNTLFMSGVQGKIFDTFDWNANYLYSRNALQVTNRGNINNERWAAALDAVIDPATGRVVCQVSLTPAAGRFPGCEPINILGPTSTSLSAYDYVTDDTKFTLANLMHDVNFSITGSPVSTWAGPVTIAVSGEYRWLSLRNISTAEPTAVPDCSGLRPAGSNCSATGTVYQSDLTASMYATQNVKEIAGEVLVPLLSDVPFARSFEVNLAGRYTDYSTSGSVETWKAGVTWQVIDDLRIRGAMSRDIRAPTLQDLFAPSSSRPLSYSDLHTGVARNGVLFSQGNADLVPEVARTNTLGIIYQPSWAPRFSIALDYFEININNAITSANGTSTNIQRECEDSGGISPFCSLLARPLPFSDRTPANFPTAAYSQNLNAARQWTRGWDLEANYRFDLADVFAGAPGNLAIRGLVTYQPLLKRQTISTVAPTESAGIAGLSKVRANLTLNYTAGPLNASVVERWQSSQHPSDPRINFDLREKIPAYAYTDISVSYDVEVGGHTIVPFVTIENLFNKRPPITGNGSSTVGLFYPTSQGFDVIGRYFTGGVRARF
jgi:outer membrane receptor protein involved in Fe transport